MDVRPWAPIKIFKQILTSRFLPHTFSVASGVSGEVRRIVSHRVQGDHQAVRSIALFGTKQQQSRNVLWVGS